VTIIGNVKVVAWNPARIRQLRGLENRLGVLLGFRLNNFGDLLGPSIVQSMLAFQDTPPTPKWPIAHRRLLTVGSILHFAKDGDTVWGSGINGKVSSTDIISSKLDIRALRGPLSAETLSQAGHSVTDVYGDPALLLFELGYPRPVRTFKTNICLIPNINDLVEWRGHRLKMQMISPCSSLDVIIHAISETRLLVTSSLHALIIAEMLDVPVRLVRSIHEPPLKYMDYVLGTGRTSIDWWNSVEEAVSLELSDRHGTNPLRKWDPSRLIDAFPWDLWNIDGGIRYRDLHLNRLTRCICNRCIS
jgi:pyruvyltransferase